MSPYRIAYLIGHLRTGGAQRHLIEVLRRLDRSRFACRVYCLKRQGALVPEVERLGVNVEDLRVGESLMEPKSLLRLLNFARQLRRERISLLHCYLPYANFFGAVAGRIARISAVVVSKRNLERPRNLIRLPDAWADVVLANSPEVWRHAVEVEGCKPDKLRLLVNGIDIQRYLKPSLNGVVCQGSVVGTVVRLEPNKGPQSFVEAASRIAVEMPEARFVIIGDGRMRPSLERQAASLGLGDRVQFLGERHDVAEMLPTLSVFLLPSLKEGMSMALLEAMAAARPIVATSVNLDLIRDGETGLLVSPEQPEEMARAVLRLLRNPEWAERLGQAARAVVIKDHSADGMVERLEAIYEELLQGKGRDLE